MSISFASSDYKRGGGFFFHQCLCFLFTISYSLSFFLCSFHPHFFFFSCILTYPFFERRSLDSSSPSGFPQDVNPWAGSCHQASCRCSFRGLPQVQDLQARRLVLARRSLGEGGRGCRGHPLHVSGSHHQERQISRPEIRDGRISGAGSSTLGSSSAGS